MIKDEREKRMTNVDPPKNTIVAFKIRTRMRTRRLMK